MSLWREGRAGCWLEHLSTPEAARQAFPEDRTAE